MQKIKKYIKNIIISILPKRYILFESVPDFSDNSKAVFDEMLKRGLNKKYVLVWLLYKNDCKHYPKIKNVKYLVNGDKKRKLYFLMAKCFICCNGFLYSDNPKQKSIFLTHGMYVKKPTNYYTLPKEIQYCLSSSDELKEMQSKALDVDLSKMVSLGFPRNDVLTQSNKNLQEYFGYEFKKFIVWYPTFRQHSTGMQTGCDKPIPIIWDENSAKGLNDCAKENNVLIILKPHFAQDTSMISCLNLSNIKLINDSFFIDNDITSYELLAACDSMITDYSSVYFDYTLCDKPIGLVWEDYSDYEKNPGFALDMDYYMQGGFKIYNVEDFKQFVTDVAADNDLLLESRRRIRDISNYSTDGKSSQRVVDFIIDKMNL